MNEMFNPNAGSMQAPGAGDPNQLMAQQAQLLRQRKIAELLRKQAQEERAPQGQMVSGHYVAPSWAQQLNPILGALQARQAEQKADTSETEFGKTVGQAQQNWQSQLPQAIAARPELQGPQAEGGSPELAAKAAQPVTTGQILKHTLAGMQIPGNKEAAELYNKGALAEVNREDTQAAKTDLQRQTELARHERDLMTGQQKLDQIKLAMSGKLDPEQQIMLKKMEDQTKRYIADTSARARVAAAEARMAAVGQNVKPVSPTIMKEMRGAETIANGIVEAMTTFKPEYGGPMGAVDAFSGKWNPLASSGSEAATNWWSSYEHGVLAQRHEIFGAALTEKEGEAWDNATIKRGQSPATIAANLQTRARLATKAFNGMRRQNITAGYPQLEDAFDEQPEQFQQNPGTKGIETHQPIPQITPAPIPRRRSTDQAPAAPQLTLPEGWKRRY